MSFILFDFYEFLLLESCAKDAADMNITFDDFKVSTKETEKDKFDYECTTCVKKFQVKKQLNDVSDLSYSN